LKKLGISSSESFNLKQFLTNNKNYVEDFKFNQGNGVIEFKKTHDDYCSKEVRDNLL